MDDCDWLLSVEKACDWLRIEPGVTVNFFLGHLVVVSVLGLNSIRYLVVDASAHLELSC